MNHGAHDSDTNAQSTGGVVVSEISGHEKHTVLWLSNVSHAVNHFQGGLLAIIIPSLTKEFGIGETELGLLNAIRHGLNSLVQGVYGLVTPFLRKTRILALGNLIMAAGVALSSIAGSFWGFVAGRSIVEVGSSPQHPVGASLLAGYFPKRRGFILSLNTSLASVGGLAAPLIGPFLVLLIGWRQTLVYAAIASALVGIGYLIFGRRVESAAAPRIASTGGSKVREGLKNYRMVLRNRNMLVVSLVMMVGAAGRGGGINDTFLVLHMVDDLGLTLVVAGLAKAAQQSGGLIGPLGFGWLSDKLSRKRVLQASLILSAIGSWVVAWQGPSLLPLFISLFVYGVFTHSRMTQTQAIIADSVEDYERDAAFSAFFLIGFLSVPFWGIAVGVMMEIFGFSIAFSIIATSYLLGAALMSLVEDKKLGSVVS